MGAWCGTSSAGGAWSREDATLHINALELKAILLAVEALTSHLTNTTLVLRTDNTTAMHCINNFGSLRSLTLDALARQLWSWAVERNIFLKATHIPGVQNALADSLSRAVWDDHSYSLHQSIFAQLEAEQGPFGVDLFADFSNYKVSPYLSWLRDPFAFGVDAFSFRWNSWSNLYAFSPFDWSIAA